MCLGVPSINLFVLSTIISDFSIFGIHRVIFLSYSLQILYILRTYFHFLPYSNMAVFYDYLNDSLINFIRDFVST